MLAQIPSEERIDSVTADVIYDARYATVPKRSEVPMPSQQRNARVWNGHDPGLWARNEALPASKWLSRANRHK